MHRQKGFTLIELLVVIAVLALLMAILLPALRRVRRQAKAAVCQANLRQWGMTLASYVEESRGYLPCDLRGEGGIWLLRGSFLSSDDPNQPGSSFHHFSTEGILCCPLAVKPGGGEAHTRHADFGSVSADVQVIWGSKSSAWVITSPPPVFCGSYGLNDWLFHIRWDDRTFALLWSHWRRWRGPDIFCLHGRDNIPVLLDSGWPGGRPRENSGPPRREIVGPFEGFCINRHDGYVNGLFLDWSVRKVGLKELWTLKWYPEFDTAGRWTKAGGIQPSDWPEWMRGFKDY